MTAPKPLALFGVLLAIGAVGFFFQHRAIAELRENQARLRLQVQTLAEENIRLTQARGADAHKAALARVEQSVRSRRDTPPSPSVMNSSNSVPASLPTARPLANLNTPEERARLHRRYDAFLLQQRGLPPAQAERVVDLWIAQNEARADLQAAVEQQGLAAGDEVEGLRKKLYDPIVNELEAILGKEGYAAYRDYEKLSYYRFVLDPLTPQFASAGVPLTSPQQEQLARIVASHDHPQKVRPSDLGSRTQVDWDGVARDAGAVLTPAQIAVIEAHATTTQKSGGKQ